MLVSKCCHVNVEVDYTDIVRPFLRCSKCKSRCEGYDDSFLYKNVESHYVKVLEWLYLHNNDYSGKFTWRKDFISFLNGIDNGQKIVEWLYLNDNKFSSGKEWKKEFLTFLKTVL